MKKSSKIKRKLRNRKKLKDVSVNRFRVSVSKSLNNKPIFAPLFFTNAIANNPTDISAPTAKAPKYIEP